MRLYVGNIPFTADERDIRAFFEGASIGNIKIVIDRQTQRPRGFAFVDFEGDIAAAMAFDQRDFGGRRAQVREAHPDKWTSSEGHKRDRGQRRRSRYSGDRDLL